MADSQTDVRESVRTITEYRSNVFTDNEIDDLIGEAEDEIRADVDDPTLTFYQGDDTFNLDRALVWLTCLFAKVATGEIAGLDLAIGDLRTESLTGDADFWMNRFERRLHAYSNTRGFGSTNVSRDDRTYGFERP